MDVVTMARTAREGFARGLGALQAGGVPPEFLIAAEPIAQAMSALHRIESSRGGAGPEACPAALGAARQALAQLQAIPVAHTAIDQAIEAIAGSLGLVHQLTQLVGQGSVVPAPPTQPSVQRANPVAQTQLAPNQNWQQPAPAPPPTWLHGAGQQPQQGYGQPPAQQGWQQPPAAPAPAAPVQGGSALRVDAELGAHSSTNFYKGLSGNDVVDSGGIFVATYNIPTIGQDLVIKVSLPGGYEFEALATVRWTRDAPLSGADAPPGYGAQFTQISPESRQLIYRYVRNREPLFHDDL